MEQSGIFVIVALCYVVLQRCSVYGSNNTEINLINYPRYTGCGGVVPLFWNGGQASAEIQYKYQTPYSPNEFCVWTFLAEDPAGKVTILFFESPAQSMDGIVLYTWIDFNFTSHKIPPGNYNLTIDSQHFAVAFSSDFHTQSNGFNFYIYVHNTLNAFTTPKAYFSGQNQGEFTYPRIIGLDNYDGDKRVSVVLHGPTEGARKPREYILKDLDTEKSKDFVDAYVLWPYHLDPHFKFVGRFSGQKSGPVASSDIITPCPVHFSSDRKVAGKGFTITWKVVGNGADDAGDFMVFN